MSFTLRSPLRSSRRFARPHTALYFASASVLAFLVVVPARAAAIDESIPNSDGLAQLEQRASQASPREQCFLYAELVHTMTEKAGKEIADGDIEKANATLKQINQFAHMIHVNLAKDTKRLKDAEMLMHHTTYRLAEVLHLVSGDDKASVQATLKQLDQVNDELLTQVFSH